MSRTRSGEIYIIGKKFIDGARHAICSGLKVKAMQSFRDTQENPSPRFPSTVEEVFIERGHSHHQQQELFLVVAPGVVDDQVFRPAFRRKGHFAGRPGHASRTPPPVVLFPHSEFDAQWPEDMGHARYWGISPRNQA
ncbi:hypothetical protein MPC1_4280003 [Methylocella tundrae]|nr:hypothetical protein MPC1_4280003 [Methylocella tundrae]